MDDDSRRVGIGEVVARTGLSEHTLRFYEREGLLLHPIDRDGGGRRRYGAEDLSWIDVCTKLRASGMPLAEIRRFADLVRQGPGNEVERLEILRRHEERVAAQMAELDACRDLITRKVQVYEEHVARDAAAHLWTGSDTSPSGG